MGAFSATGNLTVTSAWTNVASPKRIKQKYITIVLSSQGGATNYIAASELGLTKIFASSAAQKSDDAIAYLTAPSYDQTKLFFYNLENATDATRGDPVDVTGTFRLLVTGTK